MRAHTVVQPLPQQPPDACEHSPQKVSKEQNSIPLEEISNVHTPALFVQPSVESEIAIALMQFHCPAHLEFHPHNAIAEQDSISKLQECHGESMSVIQHVRWIKFISMRVEHSTELDISPHRKLELIAGLEEHLFNIANNVKRAALLANGHQKSIIAIYHSECICCCHLASSQRFLEAFRPLLLYSPHVVTMAMLILSLRLVHHMSKRGIVEAFSTIRQQLLPSLGVPHHIVEEMPRDPRVYEQVIELSIDETLFAVCPECCSTYQLNSEGLPDSPYCSFQEGPMLDKCNTKLIKDDQQAPRPILVFHYHHLDDWIRRLLSRCGTIEQVEASWERARKPLPEVASDFWDGSFVRKMEGPDGELLIERRENESTLLFALAVDWFNPYHNKAAGKVASMGVLFMTCLNIPIQERYKDENIYLVGVLPGKRQQTTLEHLLAPLVSDLLHYWKEGKLFVGTLSPQDVRLVRCALVQLVCDLPAARKVAGFPSHTARFPCSLCFSERHLLDDLSLARRTDLQRSKADHLHHAYQYKVSMTTSGKLMAEKELRLTPHGVRWSILNELPYWDPIQCTVLDAMHLVLLGVCQFHWRKAWRCDAMAKRSTDKKLRATHLSKLSAPEANTDDESCDSSEEQEHLDQPPRKEENTRVAGILRASRMLSGDKMRSARRAWVHHSDEQLDRLTIDQLLSLLEENSGDAPRSYTQKKDILELVIVSRSLDT
jgi:hypothetical protein